MSAIPVADAPSFRRVARRTAVLRVVLALALGAAAVAAVASARGLEERSTPLFTSGRSGIVVLDLSSSVEAIPPPEIGAVLRRLAEARARVGLALFSDVAYEALPTSASSEELRTYLRFFNRRQVIGPRGAFGPVRVVRARVVTPWTHAFRGGTRISAGLELARRMIHEHPSRTNDVVLVSDLNDSLFDVSALSTALAEIRREHIRLRVVGLNAAPSDRAFFQQRLGDASLVGARELFTAQRRETGSRTPWKLVGLGAALALLLALNELHCGRLEWRRA